MNLNNEIADFIENLLSKHLYDNEEKTKVFTNCYIAVMIALENNTKIDNKYSYMTTIVMNCLGDYVKEAYLERKNKDDER